MIANEIDTSAEHAECAREVPTGTEVSDAQSFAEQLAELTKALTLLTQAQASAHVQRQEDSHAVAQMVRSGTGTHVAWSSVDMFPSGSPKEVDTWFQAFENLMKASNLNESQWVQQFALSRPRG